MITTVRRGCFETNSSSMHAIVFAKSYSVPATVPPIEPCEYGKMWSHLDETGSEKLGYLVGLVKGRCNAMEVEGWLEYIRSALSLPEGYDLDIPGNWDWDAEDVLYVDHPETGANLLDSLASDPELLRTFVFSDGFIETTSDEIEKQPEGSVFADISFAGGWIDDPDAPGRDVYVEGSADWERLVDDGDRYYYLKAN